MGERMKSIKSKARIAGVFYLLIFICAGFAEGYVRTGTLVPGDPSTTAQNILASEGLFRLGLASDLLAFLFDAIVALLLYVILKPVSKTLSLMAAAFRLIAHPAIASLNMLNHYAALAVLDGTYLVSQPETLSLFFLDLHSAGYLIAGVFFGVHLLILGYLVIKSELFPKVLGWLLGIAALGYLIESFGSFLVPGHTDIYTMIVTITAVVGEISFTLWLLVKGGRSSDLGSKTNQK
ncbi:MAG: DUF4386 family protein [Bacteroidetes bacterium]|nr:DUF4386 family protein [Bacteroidota bacterium]